MRAGTPLVDAIREGHSEIADMLRAAGAKEGIVAGESALQQKVCLLSFRCHVVSLSRAHQLTRPQGAASVMFASADYGSGGMTPAQLRKRRA